MGWGLAREEEAKEGGTWWWVAMCNRDGLYVLVVISETFSGLGCGVPLIVSFCKRKFNFNCVFHVIENI